MVQQQMERFLQKQMKPDEFTYLGYKYSADYFHEREKYYSEPDLRVPAVVIAQTNDGAAAAALRTFKELMAWLAMVTGELHMLQGTSRPGSCHSRLGSGKQ
jgi:hypothetical protein